MFRKSPRCVRITCPIYKRSVAASELSNMMRINKMEHHEGIAISSSISAFIILLILFSSAMELVDGGSRPLQHENQLIISSSAAGSSSMPSTSSSRFKIVEAYSGTADTIYATPVIKRKMVTIAEAYSGPSKGGSGHQLVRTTVLVSIQRRLIARFFCPSKHACLLLLLSSVFFVSFPFYI